ncbi:MAG TPA: type II secretion system protein [Rhodocyclaceae bacterium]|nr:type II secretion system protein [Rhodocyclaceae bacterium]
MSPPVGGPSPARPQRRAIGLRPSSGERSSGRGRPSHKSLRAFTLIELLVTLALIGLLSTMALPLAELSAKRSQEAELRSALRQIRDGLDAYKQAYDDGRLPLQPGASGYPPNLRTLVDGVVDAKSPTRNMIYFLRRIPRDPLASPDQRPEQGWGLRSYRSPPDTPRSGDDVFDVYSQSEGVGMNGVPYREW